MSSAGSTLIQTIEADLGAFGGWLETEALSFANAAWSGIKALFESLSAEQYTVLKSLYEELSADESANQGVEATLADLLTLASQKELAWVATIPAQALIAATALIKQELGL